MNKLILPLNLLLAVGLIVLYVLHFSDKNRSVKDGQPEDVKVETSVDVDTTLDIGALPDVPVDITKSNGVIVFMNSEKLFDKYADFQAIKKRLEAKYKKSEADLNVDIEKFEKSMMDFQQKVQSNNMSPELGRITEENLMRTQQKLMAQRDKLSNDLMQDEEEMVVQIRGKIMSVVENIRAERGYDYVLTFTSAGNGVVAGRPELDITNDILEVLNKK